MIVYLWDAPPRCGVTGSLEQAQARAGTAIAAGATSARVEKARLGFSAALEPAYVRTGLAYLGRPAGRGTISWRQIDGKS